MTRSAGEAAPRIRVLVVDDSELTRRILCRGIGRDPEIEVVAAARDAYEARDLIVRLDPDVLTLDVEMPRMNGVVFLERLMRYRPMPVIILSSVTPSGCGAALRALELGAVEVMQKPESAAQDEAFALLSAKIKAAYAAGRNGGLRVGAAGAIRPVREAPRSFPRADRRMIAIGASTGGTEALRQIIPLLPENFPGVMVVQHMPPRFTAAFAESLDRTSRMRVREAVNGERLDPGTVLVAPGDRHMVLLRRADGGFAAGVKNGPLVCRQRPSVEVLFESVAMCAGGDAVGVMLTGMGADGATAMLRLRQSGAHTVAQDEKSCVVYGMPMEAVKIGAVTTVLPLDRIAGHLVSYMAGVQNPQKN